MGRILKARRAVVFLASVVGVVAVTPVAAQAELGAHWNVNHGKVIDALKAEIQTQLEGALGTFLTTHGATTVEILCTSMTLIDALLKELGGVTGKIHFAGCLTKLNKSTAGACKPHSRGHSEGLIETNALDALLKLHEGGVDLLELLPQAGTTFVTIILGKEFPDNECAIGEELQVTGKFFVKDGQSELLVEKETHLMQQGPLSALLFGAFAASIDGSATVSLVGKAHKGLPWSGIVN